MSLHRDAVRHSRGFEDDSQVICISLRNSGRFYIHRLAYIDEIWERVRLFFLDLELALVLVVRLVGLGS